MNIEPGFAVVLAATTIFYLRLIVLQREQAKRLRQGAQLRSKAAASKKKGAAMPPPTRYSIISSSRQDWAIAGLGLIAIVVGLMINRGLIFPAQQVFWWLPSAAGIVAFNWGFKLSPR